MKQHKTLRGSGLGATHCNQIALTSLGIRQKEYAMYNEFTHDLQPLERPNIVLSNKHGDPCTPRDGHTPIHVQPLILKVPKAKPNWKLLATSRFAPASSASDPRWAHRFVVMEGNEELGKIAI